MILEVHSLANKFKDTHLARQCAMLEGKLIDDDNVAVIGILSRQLKLQSTWELAVAAIADSERTWTLQSEELHPLVFLLQNEDEEMEKLKHSIWKSGRHSSPSQLRIISPRASNRSHAPVLLSK